MSVGKDVCVVLYYIHEYMSLQLVFCTASTYVVDLYGQLRSCCMRPLALIVLAGGL